ncbi:helix-turn-helix domain-containing protein [Streptomyces sp. NPDC047024]|uniref:TetR/AcrR family transcriptional regulator n=1 Tax=Streptomyces sp. NPDC047024 TaxID=3155476 RepID=UPI0033D0E8A0
METGVDQSRARKGDRGAGTREAIMAAAERLYAEHGLASVSNRQIGEAAGQGNTTAVSYHFGSKTALVQAVMARHGEAVEAIRRTYVAEAEGSEDVRDWVRCLVRPITDHLASLGVPSWQARFAGQVLADPQMRELVVRDALTRDSLQQTLGSLGRCLEPTVPAGIRRARGDMTRQLLIHTCADHERAIADGTSRPDASWQRTATDLEDALVGLLTAPTTSQGDA